MVAGKRERFNKTRTKDKIPNMNTSKANPYDSNLISIDVATCDETLKLFTAPEQIASIMPGLASIEAECDVLEARAECGGEACGELALEIKAKRKLCVIFAGLIEPAELLAQAITRHERARSEVLALESEAKDLSEEASQLMIRDIRSWNGEMPITDPLLKEIEDIKGVLEWGTWGTEARLKDILKNAIWYGGTPSKKGALERIQHLTAQIPIVEKEAEKLNERIKNRLTSNEVARLDSINSRLEQISESLKAARASEQKSNDERKALSSKLDSLIAAAKIRVGGVVESWEIRTTSSQLVTA
jgi:DNA repair exonuclease SbcCD ATPase subunit